MNMFVKGVCSHTIIGPSAKAAASYKSFSKLVRAPINLEKINMFH